MNQISDVTSVKSVNYRYVKCLFLISTSVSNPVSQSRSWLNQGTTQADVYDPRPDKWRRHPPPKRNLRQPAVQVNAEHLTGSGIFTCSPGHYGMGCTYIPTGR